MSLLLFLTHYICFYDIQPADDLRVTSYCDNFSLLTAEITAEEEFHTRDVDSSSWYLKPDRDIILTLSEALESCHLNLSRCTCAVTKTTNVTTPTSPGPNTSTVWPIIAPRLHSTTFVYLDNPQSSTQHYPPAEAILVTPPGIAPVAKYAHAEPNSLSTSFERTYQNATTGQVYDSVSWPACLPISHCWTH
jgi:hypothetical protein